MNFKKDNRMITTLIVVVAATFIAAAMAAVAVLTLAVLDVRAQSVSSDEQYAFFKKHIDTVKELAEEYDTSWELAMAAGCNESKYGTSEISKKYHNYTGYGCYPDTPGGAVVCHSWGQFDSDRECWEAYFRLISDKYGKRGMYKDDPVALAREIEAKYCEVGYADRLAEVYYQNVKPLTERYEADVKLQQELDLEFQMAALAEKRIYEFKVKDAKNPRVAGAIAAMYPRVEAKETTVEDAAQKVIEGKYDDRMTALRFNYDDVMKYVEYVTLPE